MTRLVRRPYQSLADLQDVAALLRARRAANPRDGWLSLAGVRREAAILPADAFQLWYDAHGQLHGFAQLNPRHESLIFAVLPGLGDALESEIIAWGVEHMTQIGRESGRHLALNCRAREDDASLIAVLAEYGFQPNPRHIVRMARSLTEPIPQAQLPHGFAIRPVAGEHEVEAYVAMHREAFGTSAMTIEMRLATMRDPAYLPQLDLVAVAPDGELAAFCVGGLDRQETPREGTTDPVGTRPAFRRLGLARALLLTCCRLLKSYGAETALLWTGSWNTAAQLTFGSVGYRALYRLLLYDRVIGL